MRVVTRPVTDADRKSNQYFAHMSGLSGTIQNVFNADEIAVRIDPSELSPVSKSVHTEATSRMRAKFMSNAASDEQRKGLTKEDLDFEVNYVLLVKGSDLEAVS